MLENFIKVSKQHFCHHFTYNISLAKKISYYLSANHNPGLWCVFCTAVTPFVLVLHLNCSALSQTDWAIFHVYMYYMLLINQEWGHYRESLGQYIKASVWDFHVMTERTRLISYLLYGLFSAILKKNTIKTPEVMLHIGLRATAFFVAHTN